MPVKLKLKDIQDVYHSYNWEFIDKEYIGIRHQHNVKCPNNHIIKKQFELFKSIQHCSECIKDKVISEFKTYGWILLDEYTNAKTKMKCICPNGHEQYKTSDLFLTDRGKGCKTCSGLNVLSQEYVENIFKLNGHELLDTYISSNKKLKYKCRCGTISFASFSQVKRGHGCSNCRLEKMSGDKHWSWREDRTVFLRLDQLRKSPKSLIKILKDDPNYNNYLINSNEYHIDHIFPRKAFVDNNLDKIYEFKIVKTICNLRENIQIVNDKTNMSKGSKYNQEEFMKWFNNKI